MGAVGVEGRQFTVALVGGRRFREQCLARYLEMSGVRIVVGSVENLGESLFSQEETIDLVVIDTGDHTCSDRSITAILASLSDALPGVPVVVVSDREVMKQSSRAKKMIKVSQNKAPLKRNGFLTRWLTGSAATLARAREEEAPIAGSYHPPLMGSLGVSNQTGSLALLLPAVFCSSRGPR